MAKNVTAKTWTLSVSWNGRRYSDPANVPPEFVPVNTVAPVASGTPTVGQTLSSTTGTWTNSPTGYAYQWLRDGSNISAATAATYLLDAADEGTDVSCRVTASNGIGAGTPAVSNALGPVSPSSALFSDDFSSGDFSHTQNGWSWNGAANCAVVSTTIGGVSANYARFNFDITQFAVSELDFLTGGSYQELWMLLDMWMPDGTESPNIGPALAGSAINGNKFCRLFALPQSNYPRFGASWYTSTGTNVQVGPQAGIFPGSGTVSQVGSHFDFLQSSTRGRWVTLEGRFKNSTSAGVPNGEVQFWVDGSDQGTATGLDTYEVGNTGFNAGYLMGAVDTLWDNAGSCLYMRRAAFNNTGRVT